MPIQLSICIPTYNRVDLLMVCLRYLLPQVNDLPEVEVVVCDNASSDGTEQEVLKLMKGCPNLKYYRTAVNLGYAGNQVQCLEKARGAYIAVLCDDDLYLPGQVKNILEVVAKEEYAFIALNYYSFREDVFTPHQTDFAPEKDVMFPRAYDVMNYPSVGHFSGFIFNGRLARSTLKELLARHPYTYYERHRGIINDLAVRSTLASSLPSCFLGKRLLANKDPQVVDYDSLKHNCLEYYAYYYGLYEEGLLTDEDLAYRRRLVLSWLPRAILKDAWRLKHKEFFLLFRKALGYFGREFKFNIVVFPLLLAGNVPFMRQFYYLIFVSIQCLKRQPLQQMKKNA